LLLKNTLIIREGRGGLRTSFNLLLEIPYEKISGLTVETDHRLIVVNTEGRTYCLSSFGAVTASVIKEDLKSLIAPLDYPRFG
jgi:hypothetical protein